MDVINIEGKSLGYIEDIILDFNHGKLLGFKIASPNFRKKGGVLYIKDVISYSDKIIGSVSEKKNHLSFSSIKNLDVINTSGAVIGILEDILIDKENFSIKAVVISTGFLRNLKYGKKIVLKEQLILGEHSVFYQDSKEKCILYTKIHEPRGH